MAETEIQDGMTEEEEAAPKRSGVLPLVAVLIATLAGGGFIGAKAIGPKLGPALAARAEAPPKKKKSGSAEGEESTIYLVDNLVVNPASSTGSRFLLTSIALETSTPEDAVAVGARDVEIRDAFNRVLGMKTVDQLSDMALRAGIVRELMDSVATIVGPGVVVRVLIPQFVIQ